MVRIMVTLLLKSKTQLLVKPGLEVAASEHFGDMAIVVKTDGVWYIGARLAGWLGWRFVMISQDSEHMSGFRS